jgi:putative sigma-54 modulation protein
MELRIQSIHFKASEDLKAYLQEKCDKLDQFFDGIVDGEAFLKLTNEGPKGNKEVEIKLNVPQDILIATEIGKTFEEATDICTDRLKTQLKKYKDKMRAH